MPGKLQAENSVESDSPGERGLQVEAKALGELTLKYCHR